MAKNFINFIKKLIRIGQNTLECVLIGSLIIHEIAWAKYLWNSDAQWSWIIMLSRLPPDYYVYKHWPPWWQGKHYL